MMKLNVKQTVYIGLSFMTIMLLWGVYNWFIPLFLADFLNDLLNGSEILIGIIMALDNLFALFMIPLISNWSDKVYTKIGKRMPFIIIGTILSSLSFAFIPITNEIGPILLIINILIVLLSMNIYRSPSVSLIPDVTISPLRNKANSIINICGGVGIGIAYILNLLFAENNPYIPFYSCSFLMILSLIIMIIKINENKIIDQYNKDIIKYNITNDYDDKDKSTNLESTRKKNVFFILLTVFFVYMANNAVETWLSSYSDEVFKDVSLLFNLNPGTLLLIPFGMASFIFAVPSALLADKIGRKKTILFGCILLMIGYLGVAILGIFVGFSYFSLLFYFIGGIGFSFITINIYTCVVENCSNKEIGKYTGKYYSYSMIAQSITPALSGLLISNLCFDSMNILFPYSSVFIVLSFISMLFVKE